MRIKFEEPKGLHDLDYDHYLGEEVQEYISYELPKLGRNQRLVYALHFGKIDDFVEIAPPNSLVKQKTIFSNTNQGTIEIPRSLTDILYSIKKSFQNYGDRKDNIPIIQSERIFLHEGVFIYDETMLDFLTQQNYILGYLGLCYHINSEQISLLETEIYGEENFLQDENFLGIKERLEDVFL